MLVPGRLMAVSSQSRENRSEPEGGSDPTAEISIVVPLYNEFDNLAELAERVAQTMGELGRPWELILVDDGSTDGSSELVDDCAAELRSLIDRHGIDEFQLAVSDPETGAALIDRTVAMLRS